MSTVIIDDVIMEATLGERLLHVGRRNGAHLGFACDNTGTCKRCRCLVRAGNEHLSPPSATEQARLTVRHLAQGQRLACQAIIQGQGPILVISPAEELRRLMLEMLAPPSGKSGLANPSPLLIALASQVVDRLVHILAYPLGMIVRVSAPLQWVIMSARGRGHRTDNNHDPSAPARS